jgi:hypothetical protein
MNPSHQNLVGWSAIAGGGIAVVGFISLLLMFTVGEPFGTINDALSIPSGLLLLPLVVGLYRLMAADQPLPSLLALLLGITGFLTTMIGSILLLTNRIDFQLSLLPGLGGFGLVGLWVLISAITSLRSGVLPRAIAWAGILLAITPSLALLAVFRLESIANGLTNMAGQSSGFQMSLPVMVIFLLGFISYAGLPVWFILVGRLFLTNRVGQAVGAVVAS